MISVDLIGQIRRARFEEGRSIKEIVQMLLVSRATVRKVIRGEDDTTEFGLVTVLRRSPISLCNLGFECEQADAAQI